MILICRNSTSDMDFVEAVNTEFAMQLEALERRSLGSDVDKMKILLLSDMAELANATSADDTTLYMVGHGGGPNVGKFSFFEDDQGGQLKAILPKQVTRIHILACHAGEKLHGIRGIDILREALGRPIVVEGFEGKAISASLQGPTRVLAEAVNEDPLKKVHASAIQKFEALRDKKPAPSLARLAMETVKLMAPFYDDYFKTFSPKFKADRAMGTAGA